MHGFTELVGSATRYSRYLVVAAASVAADVPNASDLFAFVFSPPPSLLSGEAVRFF